MKRGATQQDKEIAFALAGKMSGLPRWKGFLNLSCSVRLQRRSGLGSRTRPLAEPLSPRGRPTLSGRYKPHLLGSMGHRTYKVRYWSRGTAT